MLLAVPLAAQDNGFGGSSANARMADGFDFPVGWPNAVGYHKARGFTPNGHLGDDWDGDGGGNTDLGDPVYCAGHGVVVLAGNMHMGWGNVVMVRHSFREPAEGNAVRTVDTLYGHLDTFLVKPGQLVARGQQIGTVGTAFGLYDAHLHFEVRKNINIGMFRSIVRAGLQQLLRPDGVHQRAPPAPGRGRQRPHRPEHLQAAQRRNEQPARGRRRLRTRHQPLAR